ncbi:TPA: hypothetical protein U2D04_002014 [Streptococcus suis]|nr:hypothetical protein [Streptococcus suis]
MKLESFGQAVDMARRLRHCHEADELERLSEFEDVRDRRNYYAKGIKMALRIENYSDNEIDLILKLMEACIFRRDEFELAEQSSSYADWQAKIENENEEE